MYYRTLPNTSLSVSPICLGTSELGSVVPEADAFRLLDAFVERGGNFLDTAAVYANWIPGERNASEKTIGRWLRERGNRASVVVATKGAHPYLATMDVPRLSPAEIGADVDASLSHLQVDAIDLYYLHRDDRTRPVAEIVETLHDLVKAGKLRYVACSNWRADRIAAAQVYAAEHGFQGFVADQILWNLAVIDPSAVSGQGVVVMDEALHRLHAETGMAAVPFSSQAGGLFQKLASGGQDMVKQGLRRTYPLDKNLRRFHRMQSLAAEAGLTISQIVLGYLLSQPFATVPIVGCKTQAHLRDTMDAAAVTLTGEQVAFLQRDSD